MSSSDGEYSDFIDEDLKQATFTAVHRMPPWPPGTRCSWHIPSKHAWVGIIWAPDQYAANNYADNFARTCSPQHRASLRERNATILAKCKDKAQREIARKIQAIHTESEGEPTAKELARRQRYRDSAKRKGKQKVPDRPAIYRNAHSGDERLLSESGGSDDELSVATDDRYDDLAFAADIPGGAKYESSSVATDTSSTAGSTSTAPVTVGHQPAGGPQLGPSTSRGPTRRNARGHSSDSPGGSSGSDRSDSSSRRRAAARRRRHGHQRSRDGANILGDQGHRRPPPTTTTSAAADTAIRQPTFGETEWNAGRPVLPILPPRGPPARQALLTVHVPSNLTWAQVTVIQEHLPEFTIQPVPPSAPHTHPIGAAVRTGCLLRMYDWCATDARQRGLAQFTVVDIGGKPRYWLNHPNVHVTQPILSKRDAMRASRNPPDFDRICHCALPTTCGLCAGADYYLINDAIYDITPAMIASLLHQNSTTYSESGLLDDQPVVFSTHQVFEGDRGGHYIAKGSAPESRWRRIGDRVECVHAARAEKYLHSACDWLRAGEATTTSGTICWTTKLHHKGIESLQFFAVKNGLHHDGGVEPDIMSDTYYGEVDVRGLLGPGAERSLLSTGGMTTVSPVYSLGQNFQLAGQRSSVLIPKDVVASVAQYVATQQRDTKSLADVRRHASAALRNTNLTASERATALPFIVAIGSTVGLENEINCIEHLRDHAGDALLLNELLLDPFGQRRWYDSLGRYFRVSLTYLRQTLSPLHVLGAAVIALMAARQLHLFNKVHQATPQRVGLAYQIPRTLYTWCCNTEIAPPSRPRASFTLPEPQGCKATVGPICVGVGWAGMEPVVARNCVHNELAAVRGRAICHRPDPQPGYWDEMWEMGKDWFDFGIIQPTNRRSWLKRFPLPVRDKLDRAHGERGFTTETKAHTANSAFVKMENQHKRCSCGLIHYFDPRLIQGCTPEYNQAIGPFAHAYSKAMLARRVDGTPGHKVRYGPGMTAEQMDTWFYEAQLAIPGLKAYIDVDCVRLDASVRPAAREYCDRQYKRHGAPRKFMNYREMGRNSRGTTHHGVKYKTDGNTKSGEPTTTTDNSQLCISVQERAVYDFEYRGISAGDDHGGVCRLDDVARVVAALKDHYSRAGLEAKIKWTTDPCQMEFCSGRFWPADTPTGYAFGPKPGRMAPKLFFAVRQEIIRNKPSAYAKGVALSVAKNVAHIPILHELVQDVLKRTEHVRAIPVPREEHKILRTTPATYDDAIIHQFYEIYGATRTDIQHTIRLITEAPTHPVIIEDDLMHTLRQRDMPVDHEDDKPRFVDPACQSLGLSTYLRAGDAFWLLGLVADVAIEEVARTYIGRMFTTTICQFEMTRNIEASGVGIHSVAPPIGHYLYQYINDANTDHPWAALGLNVAIHTAYNLVAAAGAIPMMRVPQRPNRVPVGTAIGISMVIGGSADLLYGCVRPTQTWHGSLRKSHPAQRLDRALQQFGDTTRSVLQAPTTAVNAAVVKAEALGKQAFENMPTPDEVDEMVAAAATVATNAQSQAKNWATALARAAGSAYGRVASAFQAGAQQHTTTTTNPQTVVWVGPTVPSRLHYVPYADGTSEVNVVPTGDCLFGAEGITCASRRAVCGYESDLTGHPIGFDEATPGVPQRLGIAKILARLTGTNWSTPNGRQSSSRGAATPTVQRSDGNLRRREEMDHRRLRPLPRHRRRLPRLPGRQHRGLRRSVRQDQYHALRRHRNLGWRELGSAPRLGPLHGANHTHPRADRRQRPHPRLRFRRYRLGRYHCGLRPRRYFFRLRNNLRRHGIRHWPDLNSFELLHRPLACHRRRVRSHQLHRRNQRARPSHGLPQPVPVPLPHHTPVHQRDHPQRLLHVHRSRIPPEQHQPSLPALRNSTVALQRRSLCTTNIQQRQHPIHRPLVLATDLPERRHHRVCVPAPLHHKWGRRQLAGLLHGTTQPSGDLLHGAVLPKHRDPDPKRLDRKVPGRRGDRPDPACQALTSLRCQSTRAVQPSRRRHAARRAGEGERSR